LILGVFFTSLYYFFFYDSGDKQTKAIAQAKVEINAQKKALSEVSAKLDHAHEYQRSAAEMGEALNKLLAYIPENFRTQDFMKIVSEQAKAAGLNINHVAEVQNMDQRGEKQHPDFEALAVTVELEGTFAQQMSFLASLTKEKQIFIVEKFALDLDTAQAQKQNPNEVESPLLNFKAEIHAYRYIGGKKKS
jgi:Tfp pilus assembly protein PilO